MRHDGTILRIFGQDGNGEAMNAAATPSIWTKAAVAAVVAELLTPVLREVGYRGLRGQYVFRRATDTVISELILAISFRPPSLSHSGMLVEPRLVVRVPEWEADAARRLSGVSNARWDGPSIVVSELLDWFVAGPAPHWTLPDNPTGEEVDAMASSLQQAVRSEGIPYLEGLRDPEHILEALSHEGIRILDQARLTLSCGALLAGRPDLALRFTEGVGTWRRQQLSQILGLEDLA